MVHWDRRSDVAFYVARQSLVSAMSPPCTVESIDTGLSSAFQDRMVRGDLESNAVPTLESRAAEIDGLVIDLIDERLGLLPLARGSFATDSQELRASRIRAQLPHTGTRIPFGTPEHLALWRSAAEAFVEKLDHVGLRSRTVVLATPFASSMATGAPVAPFLQVPASTWNAAYASYFLAVEELGLEVVHLPADLAISDDHHRWGPSPYHYADSAYAWLMNEVRKRLRLDSLEPAPDDEGARGLTRVPVGAPIMPPRQTVQEGLRSFDLRLPPRLRRWRLRVSNYNERTATPGGGSVELGGLWLSAPDGESSEPRHLMSRRRVPGAGDPLVTPWFDALGARGTTRRLFFRWRSAGARPPVLTRHRCLVWPAECEAPVDLGSHTGESSPYLPLTWTLEAEHEPGIPVAVGWGDETLLGAEEVGPLERWGERHQTLTRSICFPGTSLHLWLRYERQWERARLHGKADVVFHAIGLHDIRNGATVDELRTRFTESVGRVKEALGPEVTVVTIPSSLALTKAQDEVRLTHNKWLVDTYDGDVAEIRDGEMVVMRPRLRDSRTKR